MFKFNLEKRPTSIKRSVIKGFLLTGDAKGMFEAGRSSVLNSALNSQDYAGAYAEVIGTEIWKAMKEEQDRIRLVNRSTRIMEDLEVAQSAQPKYIPE